MSWQEALLYGAIQGITEYLPISSSAHLILLPKFLGSEDPGMSFDIFLHLGTLMATLLYFWRDWLAILKGFLKNRATQGGTSWVLIVVATLPALVAGGVLHSVIKEHLRENWIQASALALGGFLLFFSDRLSLQYRHLKDLTPRDALGFGLAQCLALIPGMSRSGSTIMAGRWLGFDRASAARFSFLMSAPVTLAALVFDLRHWRELMESNVGMPALLVGGMSAFVFGCLAIGGLMKLLKRFGYMSFAIYRLVLAVVIVLYLGF